MNTDNIMKVEIMIKIYYSSSQNLKKKLNNVKDYKYISNITGINYHI